MIRVGKVAMIDIDSVIIKDRARHEMGDLTQLKNSMESSGLIQPLAVKNIGNNKYQLLAGERRYTVLKQNKVTEIPVRIYEQELSSIDMKIIEKSENFYRKDMEYWEYDNIIKEIHELQQSIHGKSAPGPTSSGGHNLSDTAEMFGVSKTYVSQAIKRAEIRTSCPELFDNCKTQKDAIKAIKRLDEMITKDKIIKELDLSKANSLVTKLANCYIHEDFFTGIEQVPSGIMHMIEIDPPYAINLDGSDGNTTNKKNYSYSDSYNEIKSSEYRQFLARLFKECYRVAAQHSWLVCWFAPEPWFEIVHNAIIDAGFTTHRMCGIWNKSYGQCMCPETYLANSYETFFYARKGQPVLNKHGRSNVFTYSHVPTQKKIHPTEKPLELMKEIYTTFCFPGSRILIPFLGSGNGLLAANELGMSPVGFELSKEYRDSFLVRVNEIN